MPKIRSFGTAGTIGGAAIGGITDWGELGMEANIIDVTSHESDDNSREFLGGLLDGGETTISGFYVPSDAGQDYIRGHVGEAAPFVLTFSNTNSRTCQVIIKSYGEGSPLDDATPFTATFKVTGKIS